MALALNYLIAFLLLVTILYCWRLNRRIVELHQGKKELLTLLKAFDQSIIRAEEGTRTLKNTCANLGHALQEDIDKAKFLVEDLNFMIDRAAAATDTLENRIQTSRSIASADGIASPNSYPPPRSPLRETSPRMASRPHPSTSIKRDAPNPMPETSSPAKSKRTGIELLLEKLAGRKDSEDTGKPLPQEKQIAYKTPCELGAMDMESPSSPGKIESDLMKLLKSTQ